MNESSFQNTVKLGYKEQLRTGQICYNRVGYCSNHEFVTEKMEQNVCCNREFAINEFVITEFVITEFDCIFICISTFFYDENILFQEKTFL